jgi:hypothetical protein
MDTATQVASDAVLTESLEQATRGPADLNLVHKTVTERLRDFNERMHADLVLATDGKGRVVARSGLEEEVYRDEVDGVPLVADGLRGLRGDDTWILGGRLYRVAASPVVTHDRCVGVVVIGREVNAELARTMKRVLGVEVVFLLRGRVLASSNPTLASLQALPALVHTHAAELGPGGHPLLTSLEIDGDREGPLVVLSPMAGDAAEQGALYALVAARTHANTTWEPLLRLGISDLRTLPPRLLGIVGGGTALLLILGLFIQNLEVSRLRRRLHETRGDELPLDDE